MVSIPIHSSEGQQPSRPYRPLPPGGEALMTPAEVAAVFRVDPKTVTRWAKQGKLRCLRTLGSHRRYYRADIDALLRGETPAGEAQSTDEAAQGWGVQYTHPGGGARTVRPCKSLGHARAVLAGLPDDYRSARIVVGIGGSWAPYEDTGGAS